MPGLLLLPNVTTTTTTTILPSNSSLSSLSNDTLSLYWDLASKNVNIRTKAASNLITQLALIQSEWCNKNIHQFDENQTNLDDICAPDVSYALKRLMRGLASSRDGARQGFSVALTELLKIIPNFQLSKGLDLLLKNIEITGSMKSQEERDGYFGRIFGFLAFALSGILAKPNTTIDDIQRLVTELNKYEAAKSYLRECSTGVLISIIESLSNTHLENQAIDFIISRILLSKSVNTPEQLWLGIVLQKKNPKHAAWKNFTTNPVSSAEWENSWILHPKNNSKLIEILKESSYSNPKLHGVWNVTIESILSYPNKSHKGKTKRKVVSLTDFWELVLSSMISSTPERKYVVYELFKVLLPQLKPPQIPIVFNKIFIRQLMKDLSDSQGLLFESAKAAAKTFSQVTKQNEEASYHLILQLISHQGPHEFDKLTKTRTVDSMMESINVEGFLKYAKYLQNTFLDQSATASQEEVQSNRAVLVEQMAQLVRTSKIPKSEDGLWKILQFLAAHGLFSITSKSSQPNESSEIMVPTPLISIPTQDLCKARLFTVLGDLKILSLSDKSGGNDTECQGKHKDTNNSRQQQIGRRLSSGNSWAYDLNIWIQSLSRDYPLQLNDESLEIRNKVIKSVKSLHEKMKNLNEENKDMQAKYCAFESLFSHAVLQLHVDPEDAADTLNELLICYAKLIDTSKPEKNASAGNENQVVPQPADVLVDILISFLSRPSALFREVAEEAFSAFSGDITRAGLNVIFEVLTSRSGIAGAKDLFDTVADDKQSSTDYEGSEDEDVEMEDAENAESNEGESDEADPESQGIVDEESDLPSLAIQSALASDGEEKDAEELLNDADMEVFDDKVVEIFKQRNALKTEVKDAKQKVLHFKLRIIGLFEIYIKKQFMNPLILSTFLPLLRIISYTSEDSDSQPIYNKGLSIFKRHIFKLRKYPIGDEAVEQCIKVMKEVHVFIGKVREVKVTSQLCSGVCMVLIRILNHQPNDVGKVVHDSVGNENEAQEDGSTNISNKKRKKRKSTEVNKIVLAKESIPKVNSSSINSVIEIYSSTLEKYMTSKRSHTNPLVFTDLITRYPDLAWEAFSLQIIKYLLIENLPRPFQLVQSYAILGKLFNHLSLQMEDMLKDHVKKVVSALSTSLIANIKSVKAKDSSSSGRSSITTARWKEILTNAIQIGRRTKKMFDNSQFLSLWKCSELEPTLDTFASNSTNPSVSNLAKQLISLFV